MKIRPRILSNASAILVVGLMVALPVLGLDCEMACAGGGRGAASTDAVPPAHCPAHEDSRGSGPANAPSNPDRCSHHEDSPAVKITVEGAGTRLAASIVANIPPSVSTLSDRRFFLADGRAPIQARSASSHLSRVLRL
jgi:hypothetical protein